MFESTVLTKIITPVFLLENIEKPMAFIAKAGLGFMQKSIILFA